VALKTVAGFTKLEQLNLRSTNIGDNGMKSLTSLKNLKDLNIGYCRQISNVGLANLAKLKKLQKLNLSYTQANTASMAYLSGLTEMRDLNLRSCRVIRDISKLSGLTKMETLELSYLPITNTTALKGMTKLKSLRLYSTSLNDAGLTGLIALKSLKTLDLQRTQLTLNGFNRVKLALRGTQVTGTPRVISTSYTRPPTISSTNTVKLIIKGSMDNSAKRALLEKLKVASAVTTFSFYSIYDTEAGTVFELSPISDPKLFATQLKTAKVATATKIDTVKRELTIELLKSSTPPTKTTPKPSPK
jgi:Leucine-rich repeat (LRR) protein